MRTLLFCVGFAASLFAADHKGAVTFGGLPLPGATITVSKGAESKTAVSDNEGAYAFTGLADGDWTLRVEMLCFAPVTQPAGAAATVEMKLLPADQIAAVTAPGFQRSELKAAPAAKAAAPAKPSAEFANLSAAELSQKAADGFLIHGSTNNGAVSPFALGAGFGNYRHGSRSAYSGNFGLIVDNSALDARPFSLTGQDTPRPGYNRMTGVMSFGGPLKIPRLLKNGPNIVVNYEWTRNRNASTQSGLMPTDLQRNGILAAPATDPVSGIPFTGNRIPLSRVSPQANALLAYYPSPNFASGSRYNFQIPIASSMHQDSLQSRANKTIGTKHQVSGDFNFQSTRTDNPNLFGFLTTGDTTGLNGGASWRWAVRPRFFTTAGVQFSRQNIASRPFFAARQNVSAAAGITGNNQEPTNWGPPSLSFTSGISTLADSQPSLTRNQTTAVILNAYWNRGYHGFTFGGDIRRQQFNLLGQQDPRGSFTFTGASTRGNDFAGFLLGIPDTASIAFGNADKYMRGWFNDVYFTDDWRLRPGVTLNAGVRWEYGSPLNEKYGRLVNLAIKPGFASASPAIGDSLIAPTRSGFQPRIGLSWRPTSAGSMVIRAGYGIYYNTSVYLSMATRMSQQAPLSTSVIASNTAANPLTLANGFRVGGASSSTASTFAIDPSFRVGYAHNWQASLQRDLPAALVFVGTYAGVKGLNGARQVLPNTYPLGAADPCPTCPRGFTYVTSDGGSMRNAVTAQLRRRLYRGIGAQVEYTWARATDNAALGGRNQGTITTAQNWLDKDAERGPSNFDQRHLATFQTQYTSGIGARNGMFATGWRGALIKDWTITTQLSRGSGLPITPIYPFAVNGTGTVGSLRPDLTGVAIQQESGGLHLNPAAFTAPKPGQWGNAGRGSIRGPGQFTSMASMSRAFRLNDRLTLDARIDATNPLNHVNYPSWNAVIGGAQFGLPMTANPMRGVQTTLRVRF